MDSFNFCTNCGITLPEDANFCGGCGKPTGIKESAEKVDRKSDGVRHQFIALVDVDDSKHWKEFVQKIRLEAEPKTNWAGSAAKKYKFIKQLDVVDDLAEAKSTPDGHLWSVVAQWDGPDLSLSKYEDGLFLPYLNGSALVPILSTSIDDFDQQRWVSEKSWSVDMAEYGEFFLEWRLLICPRCFYQYWHDDDVEEFSEELVDKNCPACEGEGEISLEFEIGLYNK